MRALVLGVVDGFVALGEGLHWFGGEMGVEGGEVRAVSSEPVDGIRAWLERVVEFESGLETAMGRSIGVCGLIEMPIASARAFKPLSRSSSDMPSAG